MSPSRTAAELIDDAMTARRQKRLGDALGLFQTALTDPDGGLTKKQRRAGFAEALKCATRLALWPEAEALARRAISEFDALAYAHQCLGEALMQSGREAEAQAALERALNINPEQDGARALLSALGSGVTARPASGAEGPRARPWPTRQAQFEDPRALISRYMLRGRPRVRFITPETVFLTLGSCFADNLAGRLRDSGYQVHSEGIGEEVNSTFANRSLIQWVEQGVVDARTAAMGEAYGPASRERLRRAFEACDVFVMTLGVAACFFDENGDFLFLSQHVRSTTEVLARASMRTTSVAENVENIGWIIDALRRLARRDVRVVLTVSPVPIAGTTELESAIVADCLSKSTLRLACAEVVRARAEQGVLYWPSFEIVRWLGPHFGPELPRVYGEEDHNTRHVSKWLVELIIGLFLEFHAAESKG